MSLQALEEIKCPCGETFEAEIYQSVSVGEDPELKDLILGGEFNMVECHECRKIIYAERFVLYHDREQELLAFVYPIKMKDQKEYVAADMKSTYAALQKALPNGESLDYTPFALFGMDELCHILTLEDEIADESEIAAYISKELGLKIKRVDKSAARRKGIPPILPFMGKNDFRENLLAGIEALLKKNDRLVHYRKLLAQVQSDSGWTI